MHRANWMPWNNDANAYQFRDDVSLEQRRAHQFKFGV